MAGINTIILITGIILVVIAFLQYLKNCPPERIEYRFVPRTFKENQEDPIQVSEVFEGMFQKPSPYMQRVSGKDYSKVELAKINEFFVSQF